MWGEGLVAARLRSIHLASTAPTILSCTVYHAMKKALSHVILSAAKNLRDPLG